MEKPIGEIFGKRDLTRNIVMLYVTCSSCKNTNSHTMTPSDYKKKFVQTCPAGDESTKRICNHCSVNYSLQK